MTTPKWGTTPHDNSQRATTPQDDRKEPTAGALNASGQVSTLEGFVALCAVEMEVSR